MKNLTKQEMQLKILAKVDEVFFAKDWATLKSKLREAVLLATPPEHINKMDKRSLRQIHYREMDTLRNLSYKYFDGQKPAYIQLRKDLRYELASAVQYTDLAGKVFEYRELSELLRRKPELSPEWLEEQNPRPSAAAIYLEQVILPVF